MYTCNYGNCPHHWSHPPPRAHHTSHPPADHSMAPTPPVLIDNNAVKYVCDLVKNWLKEYKLVTQVDNTRHYAVTNQLDTFCHLWNVDNFMYGKY